MSDNVTVADLFATATRILDIDGNQTHYTAQGRRMTLIDETGTPIDAVSR